MHCPHCHNEVMDCQEIRRIIREELTHLDADVANSLTDRVLTIIGNRTRNQGSFRSWETKVTPLNEVDEP